MATPCKHALADGVQGVAWQIAWRPIHRLGKSWHVGLMPAQVHFAWEIAGADLVDKRSWQVRECNLTLSDHVVYGHVLAVTLVASGAFEGGQRHPCMVPLGCCQCRTCPQSCLVESMLGAWMVSRRVCAVCPSAEQTSIQRRGTGGMPCMVDGLLCMRLLL